MLTLGQIQNSSVASVAGCDVNSPQFALYVSDAVRILAKRGEWFNTVKSMVGHAYRGCVVWPEEVESVLAFNAHGRQTQVQNLWYSFVPHEGQLRRIWGECGGRAPRPIIEFSGTVPVYYPPSPESPFAVQVTADNPVDYGKTITIYGKDTNDQTVASLRADGTTQLGVQLTLAALAPFTTQVFSSISSVVKDTTVGNVRMWIYAPLAPFGTQIAVYNGRQTSPEFLFSHLAGTSRWMGGTLNQGHRPHVVEALVKVKPLPVSQPADGVIIDNVDAIKTMVQSLRARESGDTAAADQFELNAIRELNSEMRSRFPDTQVVVRVEAVGFQKIESLM